MPDSIGGVLVVFWWCFGGGLVVASEAGLDERIREG